MKAVSAVAVLCSIVPAWFGVLHARGTYTGYSGAPGSRGTCASSCHGSSNGTITVSGFPTSYTPGAVCTITVRHDGGSRISNFNGSVRAGTGSQTAGTIAAGLNTSTYNVTGEPNGIHLTSANRDSGVFYWTAPVSGTGDVTLYLGGLQGSMGGPNTALALTATENVSGIGEAGRSGAPGVEFRVTPTPARANLVFRIVSPNRRPGRIVVSDLTGRAVARLSISASRSPDIAVLWSARDSRGRCLPNGTYCAVLTVGSECRSREFRIAN